MEGFSVALDPHTHFVVTGFDRPMDSQAIVADLLRSFLHHGGELMTDTTVRNIVPAAGDEPAQVATQERGTLSAPQVVVTSGRTVGQFLAGTANLKVVLSPLLVVYPAMSHHNFVRLTPFPEKTINHLCHDADGTPYSLIGGSYFAHIGDEAGLETARRELIEMARSVFPQIDKAEFVAPYESYKVEIANKALERNYQYHVKTVGEGIYAAVPGKFSLAFSLALDIFKKLTGEKPPAPPADVPDIDVSPYVSAVRHKRMVLDHMAQSRKVAS